MALKVENSGVYCIINPVTGDCYVGSSVNVIERVKGHFSQLKRRIHGNELLQLSYETAGGNLSYVILEHIELTERTRAGHLKLVYCEQKWTDILDCTLCKTRSVQYISQDPRVAKKIGDASRKYMSDPLVKQLHAQLRKDAWQRPEYKANMLQAMRAAHKTLESRQNHSDANTKRWSDPANRLKQSLALKKHLESSEARKKLSERVRKTYLDNPLLRIQRGESNHKRTILKKIHPDQERLY